MRLFEMFAHDPSIAKEHGMSPEKAKEYVSGNVGKKSYKNLPEKKKRTGKMLESMKGK